MSEKSMQPIKQGKLIGVGVGPGDPELLTMKAYRLIKDAPVISYLCNASGQSQALDIARLAVAERDKDSICDKDRTALPIYMPMSVDRTKANQAYDEGAQRILAALNGGRDVVFLCEGDPLFFGSFIYLLERLQGVAGCEVVPGISSVNAAAATLGLPLTLQKESFAVISGRHTDEQIEQALQHHDSVVIMKAGTARPRILTLLQRTGRTGDARYLEYIGRDNQRLISDVSTLSHEPGPYFSLFLVVSAQRERS